MELIRLELLIKDQRQEFLAKSPGTLREVNWPDLLALVVSFLQLETAVSIELKKVLTLQ